MPLGISRSRMLTLGAAMVALVPQPLRAQELQKVRLVGAPDDALTPVSWEIHTGAYQKGGLDVELVVSNSRSTATTTVVAGAYELGKGSAIASLVAHLRGIPLAIVANGMTWDPKAPSTVAVVAANSPIRSPRGRTGSATGLNDIVTLTISDQVDKDGGDSKTIKWVEIPNSAAAEAIAQHRVDVTQLQEPLYTAVASGKVLAGGLSSNAIAQSFVISVYFAHQDFAAKNPEVIRNLARVTYESATYTNRHHAETEQVMSDFTKIQLDVMRKINRPPGATKSDPGVLQPVIDVAAKYGNIPRAFAAKDAYFG